MPVIIFACKSNSCRSQMAEGWARNWLEKQKDEKLNAINGSNMSDHDEAKIRKQLCLLEDTIVTSVALDSSAVFERQFGEEKNDLSITNSSYKRKTIKPKAIQVMSDDGIDIESYMPKTVDEVLPLLNKTSQKNNCLETFLAKNPTPISHSFIIDDDMDDEEISKSVDKLIVLCSCGDELKYKLVRRSKSVEEWTIDPPTTAAKSGEGDAAYRRVSLEIRSEVNILMSSLIQDAL
mmetsp:Transcript_8138/g.9388  ORF Transcript_8138/g.9388 Transcript_8138/m.9388 type:complete len:235 (+) Transcript_8138:143-847(+)